jgi:hypothetical protein
VVGVLLLLFVFRWHNVKPDTRLMKKRILLIFAQKPHKMFFMLSTFLDYMLSLLSFKKLWTDNVILILKTCQLISITLKWLVWISNNQMLMPMNRILKMTRKHKKTYIFYFAYFANAQNKLELALNVINTPTRLLRKLGCY